MELAGSISPDKGIFVNENISILTEFPLHMFNSVTLDGSAVLVRHCEGPFWRDSSEAITYETKVLFTYPCPN